MTATDITTVRTSNLKLLLLDDMETPLFRGCKQNVCGSYSGQTSDLYYSTMILELPKFSYSIFFLSFDNIQLESTHTAKRNPQH
jgi:hypothetical protein